MSADVIVGLHDPTGRIASQVEAYVGDSHVVVPSEAPQSAEEADAGLRHLYDKELLLRSSTHIIVRMSDMQSLSILTGALRLLLEGTLEGVMAIGPAPLEQLFIAARYDGTEPEFKEKIAKGKFLIAEEFDLKLLKSFLSIP